MGSVAARKIARMIDGARTFDRPSRDPPNGGDDHVKDNFRSSTRSFGSRRSRNGGRFRPHRASSGDQNRAGEAGVLSANAGMNHHGKHFHHHSFHKRMGALKTHKFSKLTIKHVAPATKRG